MKAALIDAGVEIAARREGGGEPLVLLHSLGLSSWMWDDVIERFSGERQVLAPDFPGYGASGRPECAWMVQDYAAAVIELLDHCGVDRFELVGNSFGAVVATELASRWSDRVRALALLGLPIWPDEEGRRDWLRTRTAPLAADGSAGPATLETARALLPSATGELVERMNRDRAITGPWYQQTMWALAAYDVGQRLQRLSLPTLLAYGEHDPFRAGAPVAQAAAPSAQTATIAGGGHFAPVDAPQETAKLLAGFLAERAA